MHEVHLLHRYIDVTAAAKGRSDSGEDLFCTTATDASAFDSLSDWNILPAAIALV